jgi:lipocalin-like protein
MRLNIFIAITLLAFTAGQSSVAQSAVKDNPQTSSAVADQLVGAWRLVSIETIRANGEVIYPFYGKHPEGLLMYDRNGWISVQIVSDPKPTQPTADSREDFLKASPAEKAAAIDGYYGYFGTWTIDPSAATVTHHIQQSLYPAERGENGVRHFVLDGDRLTLVAKTHEMGEDHVRKLVWERAPAQK